jgi:hypothetical protein
MKIHEMLNHYSEVLYCYDREGLTPNLMELEIGHIRGKMLIVQDYVECVDVKEGRYRYADHDKNIEQAHIVVYDKFTNIDDYETMKLDQLAKWKNASGSYLFLLSWTLTPGVGNLHVHTLANIANKHLLEELKNGINNGFPSPNIVYIDFMNEKLAQGIAAFNFYNR